MKYERYLSENKEAIDATIFYDSETYYKCAYLIETIEEENNPDGSRNWTLKSARDTLNNVEEELFTSALESCVLRDPSRRSMINSLLHFVRTRELTEEHRDDSINTCLDKLKKHADNQHEYNVWKRRLNTAYADKAFELVNDMLGSSNDANDMKLVATFKMIKGKTFEKDRLKRLRDLDAVEGKHRADRVENAINRVSTSAYLAEPDESEGMVDLMESLTTGLSSEGDDDAKITELADKVRSLVPRFTSEEV